MTLAADDSPYYEPSQGTLLRLWLAMVVFALAVGGVALARMLRATIAPVTQSRV